MKTKRMGGYLRGFPWIHWECREKILQGSRKVKKKKKGGYPKGSRRGLWMKRVESKKRQGEKGKLEVQIYRSNAR